MDLQERLEQCRKDKQAIEQQEKELLKKIQEVQNPKWKHGDVFINKGCYGPKIRILIRDLSKLGGSWCITSGDTQHFYWNSYEKACDYINKRLSNKHQEPKHVDIYEYQYNIFERKV